MWNPFWNREEGRLRMVWRILLQQILLVILTGGLGAVAFGVGLALYLAGGGQLPDITSPNAVVEIMEITSTPVMNIFLLAASATGMLGSVFLAGWLFDRRKPADFGFHFNRAWWLDLGFGLGLGAVLMVFMFAFEWAAGWVQIEGFVQPNYSLPFWLGIGIAALQFLIVGIQEELFSRGYQLHNLAEGFNWRGIGPKGALLIGYVLSSSVFGLLHLGNPNTSLMSTLNLIVAGLFLGLGYILTGELALPIGLHITWNFFQGNVFGFPVSGTNAGPTFIAIQQGGPDWATGGAFGPEAGMLGLLAIGLGCILILAWVKRTRGSLRLLERLAIFVPFLKKKQPVAEPGGEHAQN
jgi:uncharacterized protein